MDHSYPYIASLTREPFLFYEMRSTAKLMAEGNSDDTIVKEIVEQNLFFSIQRKNLSHVWRKPASNGFMLWKMIRWFLRLHHSRRMWQNRFVCMR